MIQKLKKVATSTVHIAKIVWQVPAVQSVALTWLIRAGVPGAAILVAVIDALVNA